MGWPVLALLTRDLFISPLLLWLVHSRRTMSARITYLKAHRPLFPWAHIAPFSLGLTSPPFPLDSQNADTDMVHATASPSIDADGSVAVLSSFSRSIGSQPQYWAHLKPDTGIHEDPSLIGEGGLAWVWGAWVWGAWVWGGRLLLNNGSPRRLSIA